MRTSRTLSSLGRLVLPIVRPLGRELWEVRINLKQNRIVRDLDLALRRRKGRHMKKKNIGSSLDSWLREEGLYGETTNTAIKRVVARQVEAAMQEKGLSKAEMAKRMNTSRAALNRLLDPDNDAVTLSTLQKAAAALGREIRVELV